MVLVGQGGGTQWDKEVGQVVPVGQGGRTVRQMVSGTRTWESGTSSTCGTRRRDSETNGQWDKLRGGTSCTSGTRRWDSGTRKWDKWYQWDKEAGEWDKLVV